VYGPHLTMLQTHCICSADTVSLLLQAYKYPRRLRTGRALATDDKRETNAPGDIWVPQDEDFDETKSVCPIS